MWTFHLPVLPPAHTRNAASFSSNYSLKLKVLPKIDHCTNMPQVLCASATRCTAIVLYCTILLISTPLHIAQAVTIARHFHSTFYRLYLVTFAIDMVKSSERFLPPLMHTNPFRFESSGSCPSCCSCGRRGQWHYHRCCPIGWQVIVLIRILQQ